MTVQLTPFLFMDGNAKEAIHFYTKALDAKVLFSQTYGDGPANPNSPLPDNMRDLVSHSVVKIGETNIMIADGLPGQSHPSSNRITICISTNEMATSRKYYEALKLGGHVDMPLQETHFSPAYAMVTDKFGITFQIFTTTSEEAVTRGHQKNA